MTEEKKENKKIDRTASIQAINSIKVGNNDEKDENSEIADT